MHGICTFILIAWKNCKPKHLFSEKFFFQTFTNFCQIFFWYGTTLACVVSVQQFNYLVFHVTINLYQIWLYLGGFPVQIYHVDLRNHGSLVPRYTPFVLLVEVGLGKSKSFTLKWRSASNSYMPEYTDPCLILGTHSGSVKRHLKSVIP